ncbi:dual specificity protein phosphatase PHS1-like isoform X2 [Vicia villosa]|uniref:dual specificity protein phosphatase PHS1-like isoform X2 n=1 Tax=Vicia villosa TaxID=3911 RepID=UPI00273AD8C6|nr:dual specificity protein phosphatase PHS1-like isoform X2 [Vicia villosa]
MSNQQQLRRESSEQQLRREAPEQQHRHREAPSPTTICPHNQDKDQFDSPQTVSQWLRSVRKRTSNSGFPRSSSTIPFSFGEDAEIDMVHDISVRDRLGKAEMLDIDSGSFSWDTLSSLHHIEHTSSNQHSEDEVNRSLEITVNSGGVVFFALFNVDGSNDASPKEAAAVIKISSSRMATQSERLGYEFAKWLGVQAPQARVIHNTSLEWLQIKKAAEKARDAASCESNVIGETTCSELLEALELSRCVLFMSYVHGSPLLESSSSFESRDSAERTSAALGRIMMLDLVIRNEDRLPCRQLRWRGNPANLLLTEKAIPSHLDTIGETFDLAMNRYEPGVVSRLEKKKRSTSRSCSHDNRIRTQSSHLLHIRESSNYTCLKSQMSRESIFTGFNIVAIDSGVPRRPPAVKRVADQVSYPKLVELVLNSSEFSSRLLHDITGGKLGSPPLEDITLTIDVQGSVVTSIVQEFRSGFRAALRDLQGFHIFLLTLHQKLDNLLRLFNNTMSKVSLGESENGDSPSPTIGKCLSSTSKGRFSNDSHRDFSDSDSQNSAPRALSSSGNRNVCDSVSPMSREGCHGKSSKGGVEPLHDSRFTAKLREFHKFAKVDAESYKELEHWNEMLKNDAIKLCQENNFNSGFFEGSDSNTVVDAYELKIRLEHILERIALISEAANTERPSAITNYLFIGGVLSARSIHTMQHLGITHILCLCTNEIGQSDSQFADIFTYKNFSVCDTENTNISILFDEACDFIENVERAGQRILVHCFEGKSRSVTVVLAYLMLRKNFTLLEAWNTMKKVHRRAQPNDGFGKILQELDQKLHGKVSMEWRQRRRPTMKVCPICGKNAGLSSSSLKLHLQKSHKRLSSGSVDSAMTMEIQKTLTSLNISCGGNMSPTHRQARSMTD